MIARWASSAEMFGVICHSAATLGRRFGMMPQQQYMGFVWRVLCLAALSSGFGGAAAAQTAPRPSLTVTPSSSVNISGPQGGPFSPWSIQYRLSASTGTIKFAIAAPFWLSSLLKKVFEVSRWATLIQDPSARRTKDSQPSGLWIRILRIA